MGQKRKSMLRKDRCLLRLASTRERIMTSHDSPHKNQGTSSSRKRLKEIYTLWRQIHLRVAKISHLVSSSWRLSLIFMKQLKQSIALLYLYIFLYGLKKANFDSSFAQLSQLFLFIMLCYSPSYLTSIEVFSVCVPYKLGSPISKVAFSHLPFELA